MARGVLVLHLAAEGLTLRIGARLSISNVCWVTRKLLFASRSNIDECSYTAEKVVKLRVGCAFAVPLPPPRGKTILAQTALERTCPLDSLRQGTVTGWNPPRVGKKNSEGFGFVVVDGMEQNKSTDLFLYADSVTDIKLRSQAKLFGLKQGTRVSFVVEKPITR